MQYEGEEPLHVGGPVAETAAAKSVRTVWNFIFARKVEVCTNESLLVT